MIEPKMLRGGSWVNGPWGCRSAYRINAHPDNRFGHVGFRVCCLPQDSAPSPPMIEPKVLRGGSWYHFPWGCRSACRFVIHPVGRLYHVGFRVCCLPQDSSGSIPNSDHQHGGFDEPRGEARKSAESASKVRLDLLPSAPIEQIAQVLTYGATKYGANNWCRGARWGRYYAALLRHLFAWWRGEDCDPETGLSHLAHAGCCLLFLMEYQRNGWGTDDRFRGPDGEEFRKDDAPQP